MYPEYAESLPIRQYQTNEILDTLASDENLWTEKRVWGKTGKQAQYELATDAPSAYTTQVRNPAQLSQLLPGPD